MAVLSDLAEGVVAERADDELEGDQGRSASDDTFADGPVLHGEYRILW